MEGEGRIDVNNFVFQHGLDERCADGLRGLEDGAQQIVMFLCEKQAEKGVKNMSAVAWSKIRSLSNPATAFQVKLDFLSKCVDDRCLAGLKALPPMAQAAVADSLCPGIKNISAFVWTKIKSFQGGKGGMGNPMAMMAMAGGMGGAMMNPLGRDRSRSPAPRGMSGQAHMMLDAFVMTNGLDENAHQALKTLEPQDLTLVMSSVEEVVSSGNARNPSALAWSKIKQVQENPAAAKQEYLSKVLDEKVMQAFQEIPQHEQEQMLSTIDIGVVRNPSAVLWSKIKAIGYGPGTPRADTGTPRKGRGGKGGGMFAGTGAAVTLSMLDDRVQQALMQLSPQSQEIVLNSPDIASARNPSALAWSKIKSLQ